WREAPVRDHDLRGELAMALAMADTAPALPPLMEYVRSEWNARASASAFAEGVIASAERRAPYALTRAPFHDDYSGIDVGYRIWGIEPQIADRADPDSLASLMTDRRLSPWLRLFWIGRMRAYELRLRPWLPMVRSTLDEMARHYAGDPAIQRGIEGARME